MKRAYPHRLCSRLLRSCLRSQPAIACLLACLQLPAFSPACNCFPACLPARLRLPACLPSSASQLAISSLCACNSNCAALFWDAATTCAVAWCHNLCSCVVPLVTNKIRIKNCSDSCPLPAGSNLPMQAAGLLTHSICQAFPAERQWLWKGKHITPIKTEWNIQQQVLFRNCTGFPILPLGEQCSNGNRLHYKSKRI